MTTLDDWPVGAYVESEINLVGGISRGDVGQITQHWDDGRLLIVFDSRPADGHTFTPGSALTALKIVQYPPGYQRSRADSDTDRLTATFHAMNWQDLLETAQRLLAERDALRAALATVTAERDELLAACKAVDYWAEPMARNVFPFDAPWLAQLRAAIAKAKGE